MDHTYTPRIFFRALFYSFLAGLFATQGNALTLDATIQSPPERMFVTKIVKSGPSLDDASLIKATRGERLTLDIDALRSHLASAPSEKAAAQGEGLSLSLPNPVNDYWELFEVVETPIMAPELAVKFPEIKTYTARSASDPAATARFDITPKGFHAQVLTPEGSYCIDPVSLDDDTTVLAYARRDFIGDGSDFFTCGVSESTPHYEPVETAAKASAALAIAGQLMTFRLALATTGEYTQYHGGTVADAAAAVATTINRVNGIYECDLGVRLELVAGNDALFFTDPDTDGYSNASPVALLSENQTIIDSVIGSANYDIGHVFGTGGGGLAYVGCVCNSSCKARGETGCSDPVGDPYDIDYVAHEMGHQFGANHTYNGIGGNCSSSQRVSANAYEPGSGSTIMAYAGICGDENLQEHSDPYFHTANIDEINAFLASASCATVTSTGSSAPEALAGSDYYIPASTPFELTADGDDDDGDAITFCWEEMDLGASLNLDEADNGSSPLFRSFSPTSDPARVFPQLETILDADYDSVGERLPATTRDLDFRVTVRDNHFGGGATAYDEMQLNVIASAGPFRVTSPNSAVSLTAGTDNTVSWSVADTDQSPISTASVDILLSIDGGYTFPYTLATSTANDGSESVTLPEILTDTARIRVQAVGNVYFDISDEDFTIAAPVNEARMWTLY